VCMLNPLSNAFIHTIAQQFVPHAITLPT